MKNKKLIRIFALALLLCLSLLPMAALAAEGEEDAQEFVFETPDDPADESGELIGASDDALLADGSEEGDPDPEPEALSGTLSVSLQTYDEEKEQYVYTPVTTAAVGDILYAAVGEGCNNSGTLYYKWQRDGVNISGAEGQLYTVTEDDEGTAITCFVISDVETGAITSASVSVPKPESEVKTGIVRIYKTEDNTETGEKMVIEPELGKECTLPECGFTREGCTFTGYNTAADGSGTAYKVGDPYTLTEENPTLELYAQWQENAPETVTVTFDPNGGDGTMEPQTMEKGKETALTENAFTFEGHSFGGWATEKDGEKVYDDKATVTLDADTTLYAVWKEAAAETVTVTFDKNGGDGTMEPQTMEKGKETALTENAFTFEGHSFEGWATAADGAKVYADKEKVTLDADITLYAVWKEAAAALTGTVTLSGDAVVGETLTAMVSDTNNTGTLSYQWQRDGKDIEGATASTYELTDDDTEKAISCVVTSDKETGSIASEAVTVQKASPVKVTLGGKAILDQTLTTSVTGVPEGKTPVYRWTRDGEDIEGADKASYTLTDADAGKAIRCVVTDAEKSFTAVSDPVTPAARPAAPTGVTVQQHITNDADAALGGHIGRITGLNSTMQVAVSAEGPWSTVPSTSGSFTTKNPYTYYIRYKATDSAPASQPLTLEVKNFVTAVKALSSTEAKKYKYDITLSEKDRQGVLTPATTDPGEAVAFLIPYPTGVSRNSNYLTLVHDTDGKNIEITQQDNGILGKSESFSTFTLTVGDMAPLTGTVSITGDPYVGETLTAELKDTNNTGVLSYQWTRDGVNIAGATATKYALTNDDLGKKIACVVTSSVQPGSVKSAELTVQATAIKVTQLLINDGDPEIPISQPARIIGVTTDMEFSLNGGAWMPVDAVPFDVTLPGTYTFRDKTTKAEVGSAKVTAYYTIWVSIKGTGGTVTARATGGTLIPYPEVDENTWLIEQGDTVTLTFLPYRTTHTVTYLTVDGTAVTRSKTLQLRGVQKPHVIVVTFGDSRSSPRTGDTSNLGLWTALGMTSLAALAAIFVLQKRRRDA